MIWLNGHRKCYRPCAAHLVVPLGFNPFRARETAALEQLALSLHMLIGEPQTALGEHSKD